MQFIFSFRSGNS